MASSIDTNSIYNYSNAGFDGFLNRSIDTNPSVIHTDLNSIPAISTGQQVNYDQMQVTGSLGDHLRVGLIDLAGGEGRISISDSGGNETIRLQS